MAEIQGIKIWAFLKHIKLGKVKLGIFKSFLSFFAPSTLFISYFILTSQEQVTQPKKSFLEDYGNRHRASLISS
jgi:hypothetical protein